MLKGDSNIVIYQTPDGETEIDVRLEGDTVWLSRMQIAELLQTKPQNISLHIGNIYREQELDANSTRKDFFLVQTEGKREELDESATCAKIAQVRFEGNRRIERTINTYNLDMIISVDYRVNSKDATRFRMWANRILKEYLTRGYAINQNARIEQLEELKQTIAIRMAHAY